MRNRRRLILAVVVFTVLSVWARAHQEHINPNDLGGISKIRQHSHQVMSASMKEVN